MKVITATSGSFEASPNFVAFGFSRLRAAFQGMTSGYQAYCVYADLDAMTDVQLEAKGISRADLPGLAMKTCLAPNFSATNFGFL